jgi:hypothetical protein
MIDALADGDAVLSGRFGRSKPLQVRDQPPFAGINIISARIRPVRGEQYSRLALVVAASETGKSLTMADIERLPNPVLYLNGAHIPLPYDYGEQEAEVANPPNTKIKQLTVQAWVPAMTLSGAVLFKVPFCGADWGARSVMSADAPTVVRLGGDPDQTLIIAGKTAFGADWIATLDKDYPLDHCTEFQKLTEHHLRLTMPAAVLRKYAKVELRRSKPTGILGWLLPPTDFLLDIPSEGAPPPGPALDDAQTPPAVTKDRAAVVDLQGSMLGEITVATAGGAAVPFQVYANGSRVRVFLSAAETAKEGACRIDLVTRAGGSLAATVFVSASSGEIRG